MARHQNLREKGEKAQIVGETIQGLFIARCFRMMWPD